MGIEKPGSDFNKPVPADRFHWNGTPPMISSILWFPGTSCRLLSLRVTECQRRCNTQLLQPAPNTERRTRSKPGAPFQRERREREDCSVQSAQRCRLLSRRKDLKYTETSVDPAGNPTLGASNSICSGAANIAAVAAANSTATTGTSTLNRSRL